MIVSGLGLGITQEEVLSEFGFDSEWKKFEICFGRNRDTTYYTDMNLVYCQ